MRKKSNYFQGLIAIAFVFVVACGGNNNSLSNATKSDKDSTENTSNKLTATYDLTAKGIPVIITGPAGAEVKTGMMGNSELEGLKISNYEIDKDAFKLDVTYTIGGPSSKEELITTAKELATGEENFDGFVSEEEFGFIYKLKTDGGSDYRFYYLIIKDNPIEFSTGLNLADYTLEQVKTMYEAAKSAK